MTNLSKLQLYVIHSFHMTYQPYRKAHLVDKRQVLPHWSPCWNAIVFCLLLTKVLPIVLAKNTKQLFLTQAPLLHEVALSLLTAASSV